MPWWNRQQPAADAGREDGNNAAHAEDPVEMPPGSSSSAPGGKSSSSSSAASLTPQATALLEALDGAQIHTAAAFAALQQRAQDGDAYHAHAQDLLQKAGVRLFGQEKGPGFATSLANLPVAEQMETAKAWNAQADERYGIGKAADGGANRQTAPPEPGGNLGADQTRRATAPQGNGEDTATRLASKAAARVGATTTANGNGGNGTGK